MLVEDDINLSEIYKARLEAESYQVISAADGEQALALAVKEHPDLIISDVMMPKISGFDMLDILRGTEGIKSTKVIMMTALGQSEDKDRADKLGADRYLVKSQVTLEDVVRSVHEVLGDIQSPSSSPTVPSSAQANSDEPATGVDSSTAPAPTVPPAQQIVTQQTDQIPIAEPPSDNASLNTQVTAETQPAGAMAAEQQQVDAVNKVNLVNTNSRPSEQAAVLSQIQDFVNTQEEATLQNQNASPPSQRYNNSVTAKPGQDIMNVSAVHNKAIQPPAHQSTRLPNLDSTSTTTEKTSISDPSSISL